MLSDTIAAFRAHAAPDIAQIFDAGTATIMGSPGAYAPVHLLMAKYHLPLATSDFIGGAASYYGTAQGQLDSMPFNGSTPVLYYNKAMLAKAGIASAPKTWSELDADAQALASHLPAVPSRLRALTSCGPTWKSSPCGTATRSPPRTTGTTRSGTCG
ncbi:MAG: extracellular solute-binding protein [Acidimicrobiales bacterium]